jgi:hypothetical protein
VSRFTGLYYYFTTFTLIDDASNNNISLTHVTVPVEADEGGDDDDGVVTGPRVFAHVNLAKTVCKCLPGVYYLIQLLSF